MSTQTTQSTQRYIVESPQQAQHRETVGSFYEQYGWRVRDTFTGSIPMSGTRTEARRWARELNAR